MDTTLVWADDSLERYISELAIGPVGRSSQQAMIWYNSFLHEATSWKPARQVVANAWFSAGEGVVFRRVIHLEMPSGVDGSEVQVIAGGG